MAGPALLKLDRMKLARKLAGPPRPGPFGPPLKSSAWLKELITGQVIYADGGASLMNAEVAPEIQLGV